MDIVSTGVAISPYVEVWQSGHGAMEVIFLHTAVLPMAHEATSDYHAVCHLYCTRPPVNVMTMTPPHNNVIVSTYAVSYSRSKDGEELLLVSDRSSVVEPLVSPPIRRRPAGERQLEWLILHSTRS